MFRVSTHDEIVSAGSSGGRATFRNAGRTRRDGVELAGRRPCPPWARATGLRLDARYRDDSAGGIRAGNRIPGIARQSAYAALGWAPPQGWQAGIEARYLSRLYADDANDAAAPGYVVAALSAGYVKRLGDWDLSAYARVDNLFDRRYAGSVIVNESNGRYYEPAPGRSVGMGLGVTYRY